MWRDSDLNAKKAQLAAWTLATRPKKEGGLGILNVQTQNDALLMKNLQKIFNKKDLPWVNMIWDNYYRDGRLLDHRPKGSFWWRAMLKLLTKYKGIAMVNIQDGSTVSSWQDMWHGKVRESEFPHLYSFAIRKNITIQQVSNIEDLHDIFQLPLTNEAYQEYTSLVIELENFDLTDDADIWSYIWGSNQCIVQKAYKVLIGNMPTHIVFSYLWRSKYQPKHKVFFLASTLR
jgi:hypothetical protein